MHKSLDELNYCVDVATLRCRLNSLCTRFGTLTRLDIIDSIQAGRRQAMCFLRMESADQEQRFSSELGVGRFGGELVVVVDLNANQAANDEDNDNQAEGPSAQPPLRVSEPVSLNSERTDTA